MKNKIGACVWLFTIVVTSLHVQAVTQVGCESDLGVHIDRGFNVGGPPQEAASM